MAKRNRYKELERKMTYFLLADAAVFILYLIFCAKGLIALKVITAILNIIGSGLCLGLLYMAGEIMKHRSRWMVMGFGSVLLCVLVSLIVNFPR